MSEFPAQCWITAGALLSHPASLHAASTWLPRKHSRRDGWIEQSHGLSRLPKLPHLRWEQRIVHASAIVRHSTTGTCPGVCVVQMQLIVQSVRQTNSACKRATRGSDRCCPRVNILTCSDVFKRIPTCRVPREKKLVRCLQLHGSDGCKSPK